jgi:hypothetical protein
MYKSLKDVVIRFIGKFDNFEVTFLVLKKETFAKVPKTLTFAKLFF